VPGSRQVSARSMLAAKGRDRAAPSGRELVRVATDDAGLGAKNAPKFDAFGCHGRH